MGYTGVRDTEIKNFQIKYLKVSYKFFRLPDKSILIFK